MDKSITGHYIFYKYNVASLVIVVIVSGFLFFSQLHKYNKLQYAAVTQNINTILYDCTLSNVHFSTVFCTVFITHPINRLSKAGAALVNTISNKKVIKSGNDPESIRYLELQVSRLCDHFRNQH